MITKKINYNYGGNTGQFNKMSCSLTPCCNKIYRPTWAEINLKNFQKNIKTISSLLKRKTDILAVVKANAYGHMAIPLSKIAAKSGVKILGVSSLEEGIFLRDAGIKQKILILGSLYPLGSFSVARKYNLVPTVSSENGIRELSKLALKHRKTLSFHLKVDTGMGRIGASYQTAEHLIDLIKEKPGIKMEGLYTHFASAGVDKNFTSRQIKTFKDIVNYAHNNGLKFIAHAGNSSAIFHNKDSHFDMVRPGLSLYGLVPDRMSAKYKKLQPVLSWKTKIVFLKKVSKGVSISYGRTFKTKRPSVIATLPVGYADGYNRGLSNKGYVLIKGKRCPIVGRVTMDMIMADVSKVKNASVGDEVVLIGKQGKEKITAEEMAQKVNTINYEIVCNIGSRVPRVLV
ncbi:alanine racemase [Elusimicrobiota bacterium]